MEEGGTAAKYALSAVVRVRMEKFSQHHGAAVLLFALHWREHCPRFTSMIFLNVPSLYFM